MILPSTQYPGNPSFSIGWSSILRSANSAPPHRPIPAFPRLCASVSYDRGQTGINVGTPTRMRENITGSAPRDYGSLGYRNSFRD